MENEQPSSESIRERAVVGSSTQWNLPFLITLAALLIYFGFQTLQLVAQRGELSAVKSSQEAALQASRNVEEQFKGVMTKISELANQGHAGAKMVLERLQGSGSGEQTPAP